MAQLQEGEEVMGKQLDTEAQLVVQVAALAMMCEQRKRERDEARHEVV